MCACAVLTQVGDPIKPAALERLRAKFRQAVLETALPALEAVLARFGARAHWGKLAPATFGRAEALYGERLRRFRALCDEHDPHGKFRNAFVSQTLFAAEAPARARL